MSEATVNVRYMVEDVEAAIEWYTGYLGFSLLSSQAPAFARRQAWIIATIAEWADQLGGPANARWAPSHDREGGTASTSVVDDLPAEVARLRDAGATFRNEIVTGPGGSQILLVDPSGNLVELFQPARH